MPLTFAHPAAILPFSRKSRYIHFSAMVFGSMSPDFEYFINGQPRGEFGHTFEGFFLYNLPIVILVYMIYHFFVHQALLHHMPVFLQDRYTKEFDGSHLLRIFVFLYSALFGMLTHITWDAFTHIDGYMVINYPALFTQTYNVYGFSIPLYKFLQHGSTLLGLTAILIYMLVRSLAQKKEHTSTSTKHKLMFWFALSVLTVICVIVWYTIDYVSLSSYGVAVVRMIDSSLLSLLFLSLLFKLNHKKAFSTQQKDFS